MYITIPQRHKIVYLRQDKGLSYGQICKHFEEFEGIKLSKTSVHRWYKTYLTEGESYIPSNIRASKCRTKKLQPHHLRIIDELMKENPERSAAQVQKILKTAEGIDISDSYIRKIRRELGWTFKRTSYCQLVRVVNKEKRLLWAREQLARNEEFDNVIFSDESPENNNKNVLQTR